MRGEGIGVLATPELALFPGKKLPRFREQGPGTKWKSGTNIFGNALFFTMGTLEIAVITENLSRNPGLDTLLSHLLRGFPSIKNTCSVWCHRVLVHIHRLTRHWFLLGRDKNANDTDQPGEQSHYEKRLMFLVPLSNRTPEGDEEELCDGPESDDDTDLTWGEEQLTEI